MLTLAVAPLFISPRLQITTPFDTMHEGGIESSVRPCGKGSVSTTFVAVDGPELLTTTLNVRLLVTTVTPAVFESDKSAAGRTVVSERSRCYLNSGRLQPS